MSLVNAGKQWSDEEVRRLLSAINKKKSVKQIAADHERTPTAIKAQLKKMAAEYWFHDWRTVDDIMIFTGLTRKEVEAAIKYKYVCDIAAGLREEAQDSTKEIAGLKQEIVTMKEDMKEILRLMNAIYDFETQ
jgi:hypothetical protein